MNSKQEIIDAMNRESKGAAPPALFSQTGTTAMMDSSGASWPDANFEMDKMIALALEPSKLFGYATVRIPYDLTAEVERLGCDVAHGDKGRQPMVTGSPWNTGEVNDPPEFMSVDEFLSGGRPAMYLQTAEKIAKEHPDLFLTSCTLGPLEVANYMVGMENFMMATFMNPDVCLKWVEKVTPYQCAYAKAMSELVDNVFVIVEAPEDIMPPDLLETYLPFESQIYSSIKESFSTAHTCGMTGSVLEQLAGMGETALSVESAGDPKGIVDRVGDKVILAGGVDPIGTLLQGTPQDVVSAAKAAADAGYHVIMPECGVPPLTPNENLDALAKYRD
jgi:[methyl-Co(III) methanol-specific corrinoid protein]:coenzyme M methyltransferase